MTWGAYHGASDSYQNYKTDKNLAYFKDHAKDPNKKHMAYHSLPLPSTGQESKW